MSEENSDESQVANRRKVKPKQMERPSSETQKKRNKKRLIHYSN